MTILNKTITIKLFHKIIPKIYPHPTPKKLIPQHTKHPTKTPKTQSMTTPHYKIIIKPLTNQHQKNLLIELLTDLSQKILQKDTFIINHQFHLIHNYDEICIIQIFKTRDLYKRIPSYIKSMKYTIKINFGYNNTIKTIPTEIALIPNLIKLKFGENKIKTIPTEIGTMKHLRILNIGFNRITTLPPEICNTPNLSHLLLGNNNIKYLPTEIGLMDELLTFYLGINKIKYLPTEIGNLTNLFGLYMGDNRITHIPTEIGKNRFLEDLDVCYNNVTIIPTEILNTDIENIIINNDNITKIPKEIYKHKNIKIIRDK